MNFRRIFGKASVHSRTVLVVGLCSESCRMVNGKKFEIEGVVNGEKIESDFVNTLRSGNKQNLARMLDMVLTRFVNGVNSRGKK